jgi:Mn-containing catalase
MPEFTGVYFDMSKGGEVRGPWNQGERWEYRSDPESQMAVDGGSGEPSVSLTSDEMAACDDMAARTASDPSSDPQTGAELGMGPGDPDAPAKAGAASRRKPK